MLNLWNPDKHLRIHNPRLRLALRMIWYCMVVSFIGGFLFTLPFLLDFADLDRGNIGRALVLAIFFGGGTALGPRLMASILLGGAMAIVSGRFPEPSANSLAYRFATGLTTTIIVHLFAPILLARFYLSELTAGDYDPRWEVAAAIAVYGGAITLSQVMAGKYLREIAT